MVILYLFIYCNADNILNNLYLSKYHHVIDNELMHYNDKFYYCCYNMHIFILCIYIIYLIQCYLQYKTLDNTSITLAFVYIKYTLNFLLNKHMTICEYESSRNIMWLFATPLMLKLYCKVNNISLHKINIYCHIIPIAVNIFIYPYKNTNVYNYLVGCMWIIMAFFIKKLYSKRDLTFRNVFLFIWSIFFCINTLELLYVVDKYKINIYYLFADMISKMMTSIIYIYIYEKQIHSRNDTDLQTIEFITYIIRNIKKYEENNCTISSQCKLLISATINKLLMKMPLDTNKAEKELLRKMLPFDFEKNIVFNTNTNTNIISLNLISVLFTDIVNYTELAKEYNDEIIFQLLHNVYDLFDNIAKKYKYLQKIETIGDAYMIVGDIFRTTPNNKEVVLEIILFAIDIIREIKTIQTPNNKPLSLRIGINIGDVSIGTLGNQIPKLCVVGNTVNVASRLQSTANIDTIQISEKVYKYFNETQSNYKITFRKNENVYLKHIGSVNTYTIINQKN